MAVYSNFQIAASTLNTYTKIVEQLQIGQLYFGRLPMVNVKSI